MIKNYCKAIVSISAIAALFGSAFFLNNTYAANYFSMGGNTYNCPDPTSDGYSARENLCYSWCFVEETKVTMADGSEKNIEDVVKGDWLKGSKGPNKVQFVIRKFNNGKVYSFNGGRYFVTDSHPFQTTKGWKSINPEATKKGYPDFEVGKLEIGDILITENGKIELKTLDSKDEPQEVYTFSVDGTNDYYADGYLVHNKLLGVGNNLCPAGWFTPGGVTYDWGYSIVANDPDACVLRDLGAPILIGAGGSGTIMSDIDILSMIYWDKNSNDMYDSGTDRALVVPTYAVSTGGNGNPYYLTTPYYYTLAGFWYNNAINLTIGGFYNYGISQGSNWASLMNQGFTTDDPITGSVDAAGGIGYITGLQVGLEFSCTGATGQTVEFTEYNCPASYLPSGTMCYTGSNIIGGPCTSNLDCTGGGTCNGYTAPNSPYKYNDAGPWNAAHPYWNDQPHAPSAGEYCRDGFEGADSDPGNPPPCWLYGTCGMAIGGGGCSNFIVNNDSTPGTCSTSSSQLIAATESTVTEYVTCTPLSCTSNRTCPGGYTLTGDTNLDGNLNCVNTGVSASLDTVGFGPGGTCNGNASSTCAQILPCACDTGNGFECDTNNNSDTHWGTAPQSCQDLQGDILNNHTINYYNVVAGGNVEATDTNNCSGACITTTEAPAVCDINDPLMAGVCYIPGGFGTTMIVTNGMIGINTTNPGYSLDVDGTIRAAEILTLSDARLKASIEKIDSALEKIRSINGYAFTWKDSGKPDLGVLAQEIEKVFTDAVATDVNGKKTVQYNALLAPVIEAIKELNTQIDTLYNEKFDNQVKRIEAIEKAVK